MTRPLNILLLADDRHPALTLIDHIKAVTLDSRHRWFVVNPIHDRYAAILNLGAFDVVAIHYSLAVIFDHFLPPAVAARIAAYQGLKIQFIQDENRWVNKTSERVADLGVDVLFTLVQPQDVERAYNNPRLRSVKKVSTLPGFIPDHLASYPAKPIRERSLHIAYRSRRVPYWLGDLGQDKVRIAEGTSQRADAHGLRCEISVEETSRIYGPAWFEFIASAKSVLGTEGGASIWDYDSRVQELVDGYLALHPSATYEEVAPLLAPYEANMLYNTMSPRLFEAAALRTAMVMFPGWYNGVAEPGRHYIPLNKDFSNFGDVAEQLQDDGVLQAMVDRTYDELVRPGRYSNRAFVHSLDQVIDEAFEARRPASRGFAHWPRLIAPRPGHALTVAWLQAKYQTAIAPRWALVMATIQFRLGRLSSGPKRCYAWCEREALYTRVLMLRAWKFFWGRHYTPREKVILLGQNMWSHIPGKWQHGLYLSLRGVLPGGIVQRMQMRRRSMVEKRARLIEEQLRAVDSMVGVEKEVGEHNVGGTIALLEVMADPGVEEGFGEAPQVEGARGEADDDHLGLPVRADRSSVE